MRSATAFVIGIVIGVGVAILFAPKSLDQIRQRLADRVAGPIERGHAKVRDITNQAIRVADQAKDQVQRVQDAVDAGVRAFKEGKNATSHRSS